MDDPFGKILIFRRFELHVFILWKGVLFFYNIVKHIFMAYFATKIKTENF